ncbi:hypothetical protein D3C78_1689720 [compost metagenome]
MEGEVFDAFHERRRLDQEQGVVILGACRAQEGAGVDEAVGADKTQAGVERFCLGVVRHEIDHV